MSNNIDFGEVICESVNTIVTERLRTVNFDATVVCTIIDDSQKEQGTYIVSNGSTKFTAYTTDTKLKKDQQVYVTIPNNDYGEQKMILGKKTTENSSEPYMYNPPFNNFVKGSSNLVTMTSNDYLGLTANSDYEPPDPNSQEVKTQPLTRVPIAVDTDLPTTEIPFTRIGIKANFKSLLPASTIQGNYGVRFIANTVNGKQGDEALDCGDFYGNPYQFFNYINQEQVFVIPPDWGAINGIVLEFFQDNNFNLDKPEEIDEDLSWIQDSMGESITNDNNLFVSGVELYLGYDVGDFEEDNFKIYSTDNEYNYTNTNGERTSKTIKGEWVFIGEETENSTIISADALPYDKETYNPLKKNILLSNGKYVNMLCWEKGTNDAGRTEYQGVRWYRQKYGAPKPDAYAGSGWEILDPADTEDELYRFISPLELQVFLRTNTMEENYKCIVFDQLTFAQSALESEEGKENKDIKEDVEQAERPFRVDTCVPIISNTLSFVNEGYEKSVSYNKQTQLTLTTTDDEDGNYFCYNLLGNIENTAWSSAIRTLEPYYENTLLNKNTKCKVEWIIPIRHSMFQEKGYKILDMDLNTINTGNEKSWINVQSLNQQKQPIASNDLVFYKKITINNLDGKALEDLSNEENPFILTYQISEIYNQEKINNNIDCKLYFLNDNIPYMASRKFNFGTSSTSGTEVAFQLLCEEFEWGSDDKVIGYSPIIKLNQESQKFQIFPRIVIGKTGQELEPSQFKIEYSWYKRNGDNPICVISEKQGDNSYILQIDKKEDVDLEEYMVLQATLTYGEYTNLTAYLSFAFAGIIENNIYAEIPEGPFEIIYDSASGLPFDKYSIPYKLDNIAAEEVIWDIYKMPIKTKQEDNEEITKIEKNSYYPYINKNSVNLNTLIPASFYVEDLEPLNIRAVGMNGEVYWSQPLLILKNKFPNSIINEWKEDLFIDKENNVILSAMLIAGSKDDENRFSGVVMGEIKGESDTSLRQQGLYGYNAGEQSFGFKVDGTAFLGKQGRGRIELDGNSALIKSTNYDLGSGLQIDLENSQIIGRSTYIFDDIREIREYIRLIAQYRMVEIDNLSQFVNDKSGVIKSFYISCFDKEPEKSLTPEDQMNAILLSTTYSLFLTKTERHIKNLISHYNNCEIKEIQEPQPNTEIEEENKRVEIAEKEINLSLSEEVILDLRIKIDGEYKEDAPAMAIGLFEDPNFMVDWEGNTTIKGNFKVLNSDNETIFGVTDDQLIFNLFEQQIDEQNKKIDEIKNKNNENKIETITGVKLDETGLNIQGDNITTNISADGLRVYEGEDKTQNLKIKVNSDGVSAEDLTASTYLIIGGNSRFQNYSRLNTTIYENNGNNIEVAGTEQRTACFWIGGNN